MLTTTQWAWATLGRGDYPPPEPKRGPRYGPDAHCWLCGGETGGVGWLREVAIPPTFTNHNNARVPSSGTICQACAALGGKTTWERYAADHPERSLKVGHAMSWRCYSHVFAPGLHECPTRAGWRRWLLDPPEPPFLFVVATSGQKHLIFRGRVAHSREVYPVQLEERGLFVDRSRFTDCLAAFELLYALGFSKDSILTGQYHHGQMLTVGLRAWREAEERVAPWRKRGGGYIDLAHLAARRPEPQPEQSAVRVTTTEVDKCKMASSPSPSRTPKAQPGRRRPSKAPDYTVSTPTLL